MAPSLDEIHLQQDAQAELLFLRHAAPDSRTDLLFRVFPFYAFYSFFFFLEFHLDRVGEIRENSRHVGPAQCQVGDSLKITLTSDYPHMERNVCDATRLSSDFPPFYANTYIEASSVTPVSVWRHIGNNRCPSHVSETLFSTNNNYHVFLSTPN